jgi:hypothetical protein
MLGGAGESAHGAPGLPLPSPPAHPAPAQPLPAGVEPGKSSEKE